MYATSIIRLQYLPSTSPVFSTIVAVLALFLYTTTASALDENNAASGIALHGYDPVSYFNAKPLPGDKTYSLDYKGVTYHFASAANKEKFIESPAAYIPMYGGYCAYGVRMGKKLDIDPHAFEIVDNRLYVLLNRSTHKVWKQDMPENINIADSVWLKIRDIAKETLQ